MEKKQREPWPKGQDLRSKYMLLPSHAEARAFNREVVEFIHCNAANLGQNENKLMPVLVQRFQSIAPEFIYFILNAVLQEQRAATHAHRNLSLAEATRNPDKSKWISPFQHTLAEGIFSGSTLPVPSYPPPDLVGLEMNLEQAERRNKKK